MLLIINANTAYQQKGTWPAAC